VAAGHLTGTLVRFARILAEIDANFEPTDPVTLRTSCS
jgi:hypothetical protein